MPIRRGAVEGAADLSAAIGPALNDPGPVPTSGRDLVRYAGGKTALTRELSGMQGPAKRGDYPTTEAFEAARRQWRSADRRAQRYSQPEGSGKQARGSKRIDLTPAQRESIRSEAVDRKWSQLVSRGMRARMTAVVRVPSGKSRRDAADEREKEMPSGGPGVLIGPGATADILEASEGDELEAAGRFREAFFDAYGMPDDSEIVAVLEIKLWPNGTTEPV